MLFLLSVCLFVSVCLYLLLICYGLDVSNKIKCICMYARMRMRCRTSALIGCCAEWCRHAYGGFTNVGALQAFLPSFLCLTCRLAMHHVIPCRILFHKLQCVLLHFELQCYCLRSDVKVWYRTVHLYYIYIATCFCVLPIRLKYCVYYFSECGSR